MAAVLELLDAYPGAFTPTTDLGLDKSVSPQRRRTSLWPGQLSAVGGSSNKLDALRKSSRCSTYIPNVMSVGRSSTRGSFISARRTLRMSMQGSVDQMPAKGTPCATSCAAKVGMYLRDQLTCEAM